MTDEELAIICKNLCPWLHDVETQTESSEEGKDFSVFPKGITSSTRTYITHNVR